MRARTARLPARAGSAETKQLGEEKKREAPERVGAGRGERGHAACLGHPAASLPPLLLTAAACPPTPPLTSIPILRHGRVGFKPPQAGGWGGGDPREREEGSRLARERHGEVGTGLSGPSDGVSGRLLALTSPQPQSLQHRNQVPAGKTDPGGEVRNCKFWCHHLW